MIDDLHSGYSRSTDNSPNSSKTDTSTILTSEQSTQDQQSQNQQSNHHHEPVIHNSMDNISMAPLITDNNIQASFSTGPGKSFYICTLRECLGVKVYVRVWARG